MLPLTGSTLRDLPSLSFLRLNQKDLWRDITCSTSLRTCYYLYHVKHISHICVPAGVVRSRRSWRSRYNTRTCDERPGFQARGKPSAKRRMRSKDNPMSFSGTFQKPLLEVWKQQVVLTGCLLPAHGQPHCSHTVHRIKQSYAWATAMGRTCWPLAPEGYRVIVTYTGKNDRKWAINTVLHTGRDRVVWLPVTVVSGDLWWFLIAAGRPQLPDIRFIHVALRIRPHLRCGFGETGATVTTDHRAHGILTSNSTLWGWAMWGHMEATLTVSNPQRGTHLRLTWKWHEQFEHIGSMSFYVFLCLLVSATAIPSFNNF